MFCVFLTVLSWVYMFDNPFVNILEQPKVSRLIVRLPVLVKCLYFLVLLNLDVSVKYFVV